MGIGNTTSAALLMHRLAPAPLAECVGAGTGLDADGIARKLEVAERAASRSDATSPLQVLAEFGGYEIAMMAGAVLGSAMHRRPVIVDGFIASAPRRWSRCGCNPRRAAIACFRTLGRARAIDYCSKSSMQNRYLDLGLRLGEGTGAVMAVPLLRAAGGILNEMADLSDVMAGTLKPWPADRRQN